MSRREEILITLNKSGVPRAQSFLACGPRFFMAISVSAALFVCLLPACTTIRPTDSYEGTNLTMLAPEQARAKERVTPPPEKGLEKLPEGALPLERCVALALQNNPEVAAEWYDSEAASAEKRVQAGARWPNVHLTGSYFHYQDNTRVSPPLEAGGVTYFTQDLASTGLVLRLPLYTGGQLVNEIRAVELLARAAEHTLARTRHELVFNVSSTYYAILAQRHVIESLEFSRKALAEHVARVQNLIDAQKAAKVDRLRTEVRLADLDQRLIQEKNVLEIQLRLLSNLMGLAEDNASMLDIADVLAMPEVVSIDTAMEHALNQRADYAAAAATLEAQARRVDVARGAREPQIALEAMYGGTWGFDGSGAQPSSGSRSATVDANGNATFAQTTPLSGGRTLTRTYGANGLNSLRLSENTADNADSFEDAGRVGITVDIPLFEGGRLRARVARERAKLHAAQQRLRKLELQIRLAVKTATLNLESARERVAVTRKSIAEAEESLRIEREKYDFGKGAIVDVLDAQAALLNTQTTYYRALADTNVAQAELALAMGEQR